MISWTAVEDALQTWVSVGSGIPSARVVWSRTRPDRPTPPYIAMRVMSIRRVGQDWLTVHDNPLTFADFAVVANVPENALDAVAHGRQTGDGPIRFTTTGALPGGVALATDYWVIRISADRFRIASTFQNAIAGTAVTISSAGTGVHSAADTADTRSAGSEIVHTVRGRREITLALQCFDAAGTGIGSAESLLEAVMQSVRLPSVHAGLRTAGVGVATFGSVIALDSGMIGAQRFETRATLDVRLFVSSEVAEFTTFIERVEVERTTPLPLITFVVDRDD